MQLLQHVPQNVRELFKDRGYVISERTEHAQQDQARRIRFMDGVMNDLPEMNEFMRLLCREGDEQTKQRARELIYSVFLDTVLEHGTILMSGQGGNKPLVAESWWGVETPRPIWMEIPFLLKAVYRGIQAAGMKKTHYGLALLGATIEGTQVFEDGKPVRHLRLENIGVQTDMRRSGHGTAHMIAGCSIADNLDLPIVLCTAIKGNIAYFERFGFQDQGIIQKLPKASPAYWWMLRPRPSTSHAIMNDSIASDLLGT
jgi:ribosomal protein S18 acetylase RimI-like enzyme